MKVFFRRASISALTVLVACWPDGVMCDNNVMKWLKEEYPAYIIVALAVSLLVTIIGCILCLWCVRRRRGREFFTNDAKEGTSDNNSWEMIPSSSTKETKKVIQEADRDSVIIKIRVESTENKKVEKKSNEETTDLVQEESHDHKHKTSPDAACDGGHETQDKVSSFSTKEPGVSSPHIDKVTDTPLENSIGGTNDMKHDESESADGLHPQNSDKPRAEPVYAEVNKAKKKKVKSGYSIVYAELADFDKNRSDGSLQRNNPSPVEYAEIARLTKSPRDMCPLDD